jgi:hypothetical protein
MPPYHGGSVGTGPAGRGRSKAVHRWPVTERPHHPTLEEDAVVAVERAATGGLVTARQSWCGADERFERRSSDAAALVETAT